MNPQHPYDLKNRVSAGFTLLEILLATVAISIIIAVAQGLFTHAQRLRDNATRHVLDARLKTRAAELIRNDLSNAVVSGGTLASSIIGSPEGPESKFPGYLKFTTTKSPNSIEENLTGDVQEVEYYIQTNPTNNIGGELVRTVDNNLLAATREATRSDVILSNVKSLTVTFYDGANWIDSWDNTDTESSIPLAVMVHIQQAASLENGQEPSPLEVVVPWVTQPANGAATNSTSAINFIPLRNSEKIAFLQNTTTTKIFSNS
jgi:type II secretory pathway component PulJ